MPVLTNIRHERFAQNVVSGLSLSAAYVSAGYKTPGASANGARLIRNPTVSSRVHELQNETAAKLFQERRVRIDGYNERREKLLAIIGERAMAGWNAPGASTGLLVREIKSIGSGKNFKRIEEFRVDTALLRELRELEKQAAIELGQWTEKRDVKMDANVHAEAKILAAHFSIDELERMIGTALKAVDSQSQEEKSQQGAVLSAALPVSCEPCCCC